MIRQTTACPTALRTRHADDLSRAARHTPVPCKLFSRTKMPSSIKRPSGQDICMCKPLCQGYTVLARSLKHVDNVWLRFQCPIFAGHVFKSNYVYFIKILPKLVHEHDDVIKWKQFPRSWLFVRGIHWSPVNSPHKDQWRGALVFSLICVWINDWVNNREAGDLRRHRGHYDIIVMGIGQVTELIIGQSVDFYSLTVTITIYMIIYIIYTLNSRI